MCHPLHMYLAAFSRFSSCFGADTSMVLQGARDSCDNRRITLTLKFSVCSHHQVLALHLNSFTCKIAGGGFVCLVASGWRYRPFQHCVALVVRFYVDRAALVGCLLLMGVDAVVMPYRQKRMHN